MTNLPSPQRAGRDYQVGCQVAGSDPPPSISWQLLDPSGTATDTTGTSTLSYPGSCKTLYIIPVHILISAEPYRYIIPFDILISAEPYRYIIIIPFDILISAEPYRYIIPL